MKRMISELHKGGKANLDGLLVTGSSKAYACSAIGNIVTTRIAKESIVTFSSKNKIHKIHNNKARVRIDASAVSWDSRSGVK